MVILQIVKVFLRSHGFQNFRESMFVFHTKLDWWILLFKGLLQESRFNWLYVTHINLCLSCFLRYAKAYKTFKYLSIARSYNNNFSNIIHVEIIPRSNHRWTKNFIEHIQRKLYESLIFFLSYLSSIGRWHPRTKKIWDKKVTTQDSSRSVYWRKLEGRRSKDERMISGKGRGQWHSIREKMSSSH